MPYLPVVTEICAMNSPLKTFLLGVTDDMIDLADNEIALVTETDSDRSHLLSSCNLLGTPYSITGKRGLSQEIDENTGHTSFHNRQLPYVHDKLSLPYNDVANSEVRLSHLEHGRNTYTSCSDNRDEIPLQISDARPIHGSTVEQFSEGHHFVQSKPLKKARIPQPRQLRVPKPDSIPWEEWLNALRQHGETIGHCNASRSCIVKYHDGREMKIGEWLHTQRSCKRDGRLPSDRVAAMQALVNEGKLAWSLHWNAVPNGIGMTPNDLRWETRYQELLQYGALHGDYNVPYQRANYVKQKKIVTEMSSISSSSAAAFLSSPFSLSLSSPASASSNNKILPSHTLGVGVEYVLPDLRTSHGLSDEISGPSAGMYLGKSPDKSVYISKENVPLGKWLKKQRQHRQDGAIRPDRESKLQALADLGEGKFKWSATVSKVNGHDDKKWSENIKMLIAYGIHRGGGPGSCDVHTKTSIVNGLTGESKHLGLWIKRQKRQYTRGLLRAERVVRLQQLVDQGLLSWSFPEPYKKGEFKSEIPILGTKQESFSPYPMSAQEDYGAFVGQELGNVNILLGIGIEADTSDNRHEGSLINMDDMTHRLNHALDLPRLSTLPLNGCGDVMDNGNRIDDCHLGSAGIEIGIGNDSVIHKHLSLSNSNFETTSPPGSENHCWPIDSNCSSNRRTTACSSTLDESASYGGGNNHDDDIGSGNDDDDDDEDDDDDNHEYFIVDADAIGGV